MPSDTSLFTPGPEGTFEPSPPEALPEPSLTEAGAIGQALYDPVQVADGIVSLLDQMGVEITAADGTVLRPGADRGAGLLSLTEAEVRGLIEMTREDLETADEFGVGPISAAALYSGLQSSLPAGYSVEQFAAAFDDAYATEPESFAAGVMLGMPIAPETRLLRVQMWLLLVDGFVRPDDDSAHITSGRAAFAKPVSQRSARLFQPGGQTLGTAALFQPPLVSPMTGVSDRLWARLLALLPTLAFRVPFVVEGFAAIHEGHGRPGPRLQLAARVLRPQDIGIRRTGQVLIPADDPGEGLEMTWRSYDEGVLKDHGQVVGTLGWPMLTDASGAVHIGYQAKQEEARYRTVELSETGTLYAKVEQVSLVIWAYDLPPEILAVLECQCLINGTMNTSNYEFPIAWHEEDVLQVHIENRYNYTYQVGGIAELHRNGVDRVTGELAYNSADGTYRGTLDAISQGHAEGTAVLGLGGIAKCGDDESGVQKLYVVGEKLGANNLLLRFYPETPPDGDFTLCQPTIPFPGGGPYRRPFGSYLPLNDTRWSTPTQGYEIEIPDTYGSYRYSDQSAMAPELGICSEFFVVVTKVDPEAPPTTTPFPQPSAYLCQ